MRALDDVGADWLRLEVESITERVDRLKPSDFNEQVRYLPESVTSIPGYIRYSVNPFMREIVDCFDIDSPVREVNLMKGVQITYSTALESGVLYMMVHVRTLPGCYMTADSELAQARIENNFLPMLQQSGFAQIIRSSDEGNSRKTGKTKAHLQHEGGGYLVPQGAQNAAKMRSYSFCYFLKDELDAWPAVVGKDGDPDKLSDARCSGYWDRRKIFRGSTPLTDPSPIAKQYARGDQRLYMVLCKSCNFPQSLRWETIDDKTGIVGGMFWETEDGVLIPESCGYACQKCGEQHFEHDKERLFSEAEGAHWKPTAKPVEPGIRSYHLPALYSPIGMAPWSKCIGDYLEAWDVEARKPKDIKKYQVFYNNILAKPFEIRGQKIRFVQVSPHRRPAYRLGQVPNKYAVKYSSSKILFLTCQVDVHKSNIRVSVFGWTSGFRSYLIDYWRWNDDDCTLPESRVWGQLRELIEETFYTADDGVKYRVAVTLIDAGYANATVTNFCSQYDGGVYPILGRDRPGKNARIKEFQEFTAQDGTVGYMVVVDHYKDRLAPVLRREWHEDEGPQGMYHWNAPVDISDAALKELTREIRKEKEDDKGVVSYVWHRPGNADNTLWDLSVYGHAAVEILAWSLCIQFFELEAIDWPRFWQYIEDEKMYIE